MNKKKRHTVWPFVRNFAPRAVRDLLDMDYINKLSKKDKKFLNQFLSEYYFNFFNKEVGLHDKAGIPRKDLYDANNARFRDIWHNSDRMEASPDFSYDWINQNKGDGTLNSREDSVIDYLDSKKPPRKRK